MGKMQTRKREIPTMARAAKQKTEGKRTERKRKEREGRRTTKGEIKGNKNICGIMLKAVEEYKVNNETKSIVCICPKFKLVIDFLSGVHSWKEWQDGLA